MDKASMYCRWEANATEKLGNCGRDATAWTRHLCTVGGKASAAKELGICVRSTLEKLDCYRHLYKWETSEAIAVWLEN